MLHYALGPTWVISGQQTIIGDDKNLQSLLQLALAGLVCDQAHKDV